MGAAIRCIFDFGEDDDIEDQRKTYKQGNLYFYENVLFPYAFTYALILNELLPYAAQRANTGESYNIAKFKQDKALIQFYQACIWNCIYGILGQEVYDKLKKLIGRKKHIFQNYTFQYLDEQVDYYLSMEHLDNREKKEVLADILCCIIKKPSDYRQMTC